MNKSTSRFSKANRHSLKTSADILLLWILPSQKPEYNLNATVDISCLPASYIFQIAMNKLG